MTSISAQRLQGFRRLHDSMMACPERHEDGALYLVESRLATEARSILASSTLDLDFLAFLGREKAAGRVYMDEARARQVFSQAGVVAPPESLNPEIQPISGKSV